MALALLIAEAAVRVLWSDAPPAAGARESLPLERVRDPKVIYRLLPGAAGFYNGTPIQLNALGLRDRDYAVPPPAGAFRVLVLGDSMVFGIGLPPEETLPAHLGRRLAPIEVINAGVFGYNLTQEISLLRDIGLRYRPGAIVSCFVHNDMDNWGLGDGGAVPEIRSSRFDPPPADAWSTRLADLMLPGTFDADRLNLLPSGEGGLRPWIASVSRLYLFTYLRLRTHSWNMTSGERRDPLFDTPTCRAEEVVWDPLRDRYRALRDLAREGGASLAVVIQGGLLWEGWPLDRLLGILADEGIPSLDLTPVWLEPALYAREYSLGWDPHPNGTANAVAADLIAEFLTQAGLLPGTSPPARLPGPHETIGRRADLGQRLEAWRARQGKLVEAHEGRWRDLVAEIAPEVDLPRDAAGRQVLHGFWPDRVDPALPSIADGRGGRLEGLWMSGSAAVLLRRPGGASTLVIDLAPPEGVLDVTFSAPPRRCGIATLSVPVSVADAAGGGFARLRMGLPPELAAEDVIEVRLSVDRPRPATYLRASGDAAGAPADPRLVSFLVRRIAIQ